MKNISLKIAALLFALILWIFVVSGDRYTVEREVELRLKNMPQNLALANKLPSKVRVLMEGSGRKLLKEKNERGWIELELSGALLGKTRITLTPKLYRNASGLKHLRIRTILEPRFLDVELDTRVVREVSVRNRVRMEAAEGFTLVGETRLEPQKVKISGARKWITRIFEIPTEEFRLAGLTGDTALQVSLSLPGAFPVTLEDRSLLLKSKVQKLSSRSFENIPVRLLSRPTDSIWTLNPPNVRITLTGGEKVLKKMDQSALTVFVEFSRFHIEDKRSLAPTVSILGKVKSFRLEPDVFRLVSSPRPSPLTGDSL